MSIDLDILYEDENLIAVNKPAGVLVVPDRWNREIPTIQDMLREYLKKDHPDAHLRVVHRLDKNTSGVLILAKNVRTQSYLSRQFENGDVSKTYLAIVKGVITKENGIINYPLMESPSRPGTMVVNQKGKQSITHYKVLERFRDFTFVEARPLTGRTHQVRVHLMAAGYPLAIDPDYGSEEPIYLSRLKKNYRAKEGPEKAVISRTPLHASRLTILDPEGKTLVIEASLPQDFSRMLKYLRKYSPADQTGK